MKHLISVAPMMDWTDRHDRYFLRLIAPNPDVLLYTEMITAQAIRRGDRDYLLGFDPREHPVALQLGGSDPALLAEAARIGEEYGYDEINLNVGCPSPRVSSGRFGACLMLEPELVAECVAAMRARVKIPVTVKSRIGVNHQDDDASLRHFIQTVANAGCDTFIVHARKAWLTGLSPKQNRMVPPLCYDRVYQLKKDFPALTFIINGGIKAVDEIREHLQHVDGVMIGRAAYQTPYFLADIQRAFYPKSAVLPRHEVIAQMLPYIQFQLQRGVKLSAMTRHLLGLYQGMRGAKVWRRFLTNLTKENNDGA